MTINNITKQQDVTQVTKKMFVVFLLAIGTQSVASEVTIPNNFTSGSQIVAAEMNDNFMAVKSAINDNATQLAAHVAPPDREYIRISLTAEKSDGFSFTSPTVKYTVPAGKRFFMNRLACQSDIHASLLGTMRIKFGIFQSPSMIHYVSDIIDATQIGPLSTSLTEQTATAILSSVASAGQIIQTELRYSDTQGTMTHICHVSGYLEDL